MTKTRDNVDSILLVVAGALLIFAIAIGLGRLVGASAGEGAGAGSYADWLAAVATLAAFCAAVIAGKFAYDALRIEQGRDRFRDEQLTRVQAERVAAWVDEIEVVEERDGWRPPRMGKRQRLLIRNASDLPVINFRAAVTARSYTGGSQHFRIIGSIDRPVVPPTADPEVVMFGEGLLAALQGFRHDLGIIEDVVLTVGVIFTDTGGRHWIRNDDGDLRPAPEDLARERDRDRPI